MKKIFILIVCLTIQLTVNAQLKVHNNGNVSISTSTSQSNSSLSIGCSGDTALMMKCITNKNGIDVFSNSAYTNIEGIAGLFKHWGANGNTNYGLKGTAYCSVDNTITTNPNSVGVMGNVLMGSSLTGFGYGVYGNISANRGAGVCGRNNTYPNFIIDDKYAGLFLGKTKVVGDLSVTGSIQGSLLSNAMPESAEIAEPLGAERELIYKKMSRLCAISYYHSSSISDKLTTQPKAAQTENLDDLPEDIRSEFVEDNEEIEERNIIEEQIEQKKHYAITIEQLEEVFPELVYEEKDGSKRINYMEMIPLLVQSINELQAQINVLTAKEEVKKAPAVSAVGADPMLACTATLYQNTPNPFNERTEIRFSLPDDTQNANICIFDMSGKMLRQIPVTSSMQSITINGYELAAGMYLYSLVVGGQEVDTKRMIITK